MAVAMRQSRRFAASSPVARYWLVNCVGFSLAGGGHGTVERVLADGDPYTPSLLEVRTKRRAVRRIPTAAVVEVVPSERILVVEGAARGARVARHPERRERLETALRLTGRAVATAGLLLLVFTTWLAQLARAAWRVGFPVVVSASRRGGRESVRLVRSVPWQEYGRSARSATTRLSQGRSSRSSPRRTTSSEPDDASSSRERARTTSST